eukprot:gb/GFBE01004782.1/.p1 GENE.gb/GFBE01004782.1/~~gb/GFBE01004782.1/.p1  ORF type:complete len:301 (+),score=65.61 gb/GFBE01004782.1/:1-903(+)
MGLETSCLVQSSSSTACSTVSQSRGGYASTGCFVPGSACMTPGNACMSQQDARSVTAKGSDARPGAITRLGGPGLRGQGGEVLESLPLRSSGLGTFCSAERTAGVTLQARYGSAEDAMKAARRFAQEDNAEQALMTYSIALEMDEDDAHVCDEFGQFLLAHGQLDGAEQLFDRALALDPMNAQYSYRKGVVLQQRRQPQEAAESFETALRQDPRFLGALFNLGIVHRELGDPGSASEDFKKMLQINPDDPCALSLLGECLEELGDVEGAVRSLEDAVRLDPTNRSAQKDLFRLRQQMGGA